MFGFRKSEMTTAERALPGRPDPLPTALEHFVNGRSLKGPYPEGLQQLTVGMGCFWGAERRFWRIPGVWVTMVGYAGGFTPNPTYQETCSGRTGHTEAVGVVFDPEKVRVTELLKTFWEGHDPTQGMRQGNDIGSQYRSALYWHHPEHEALARDSRDAYQEQLTAAGFGKITTDFGPAPEFFFAEDYHQQYLAKNPSGYCGIGGVGVTCPAGLGA